MPKRGRDTLTGGTHDVNPQFMNIPVTNSASASTAVTTSYVMPKSPLTQNGRAQIIEILKVWFEGGDQLSVDTSEYLAFAVCTSTPAATEMALSNPKVICKFILETQAVSSVGVPLRNTGTNYVDLTDGAGHGILVATDNLYIQTFAGAQPPTATTGSVKILYRYKNVSVQEYIGIVQSQN